MVTVTGEATLVQTESAERSYAIQGEVVQNIAVNGRGFTPLASIAPGIVFSDNNLTSGSSDQVANISANGLRTSANNLQLDGISIVDTGNNGTLLNLSLDSVAEFKVLTSNYQAEYGRSAGAQISAVTKSGTKDFHGSFYTFRRHDGMNANTWFNNRDSTPTNPINKPRLDHRDIGYTIGGPVWIPKVFNQSKQKLFFFWSQEYQKRQFPPAGPTRVTVPTALERAGDFSQSVDRAGNRFNFIKDPELSGRCQATPANPEAGVDYQAACFRDGGVLGRIPQMRLNQFPLGLRILNMYPLPNTTGTGFNYVTEAATSQPERQDLVRLDWNISNAWRVYGRFAKNTSNRDLAYGSFVLGDNLPDYPAKYLFPRHSWSATTTGTLNATTVVEATVGVSHNSIDILPGNSQFTRSALGLSGLPTLFPNAVQLDLPPQFVFEGRIANGPNVGSNNAPFTNFNTVRTMSGSLSKIWGQHTFKVGILWENSFKPQSSFANNNGRISFTDDPNNPLDTGFGFANAALGVYQTYSQASGYFIGKYRYNNVEWFAQDNWKVNNRLTLDYGMRFYVIQPQYDEDAQTATFTPERFNPADAPLLYRPICIGAGPCSGTARRAVDPRVVSSGFVPSMGNTIDGANIGRIVPGTGNLLNGVLKAGPGVQRGLYQNRGVHLAPRFGFAYDVTGRQNIVIRGGAGMFYDRPQGNVVFDLLTNPPTTLQPTLNNGQLQDLNPGQVLLAPPALVAYDPEGKSPTTYAFNLGVQYKLPLDTVLDLSYVGTAASHLVQRRNLNAPAYGAAYLSQNQDPTLNPNGAPGSAALPVDFLRPYQGFGNISYIEPAGSSNYRNQRRANYGPLDFDRRHNFNVNWVYELPKATHSRRLGYALNNWQVSGVYRYQTGMPYNITFSVPGTSPYTLTGTQGNEGARIALVGDPGSGHSSDPYRQFNAAAFTTPGVGSLGLESGRNFLYRGPINNLDLSLAKRFNVKERASFELRLDAFNALNHTQFEQVNANLAVTSLTDPTPTNLPFDSNGNLVRKDGFGTISRVRPPRNMQLSLHIRF
jgi:hypothetical protein